MSMLDLSPEITRVLDLAHTLENLGGDPELLREIMDFFVEMVPQQIDDLAAAVQAGDVATVGLAGPRHEGWRRQRRRRARGGDRPRTRDAGQGRHPVGAAELVQRLRDDFRDVTRGAAPPGLVQADLTAPDLESGRRPAPRRRGRLSSGPGVQRSCPNARPLPSCGHASTGGATETMRGLLAIAIILAAVAPAAAMLPRDLLDIQTVGIGDLSPDGRLLIYTHGVYDLETRALRTSVYLRDLDTGDETLLFAPDDGADHFAWRPDGQAVAYTVPAGDGEREVWLMDAAGGDRWPISARRRLRPP